MRDIVLFTGGVDSLLALDVVASKLKNGSVIDTVYFNLRSKCSEAEIEIRNKRLYQYCFLVADRRIGIRDNVYDSIDLSIYSDLHDQSETPVRNLILASVTAGLFAGEDLRIHLTVQKGEMSIPDRSTEFFEMSSKMLSMLTRKTVEVNPVFPHLTKVQAGRAFVDKYGIDRVRDLLTSTYSCYYGLGMGGRQCGECGACIRQAVFFANLGLYDKSKYISPPFSKVLDRQKDVYELCMNNAMMKYHIKATMGHFDTDRNSEIVSAYNMLKEIVQWL